MKALPIVATAAMGVVLYKSPGARSWLGSLLLVLGHDILDTLPDVDLDDEARERMRERIMTEIRAEQPQQHRNGDRP